MKLIILGAVLAVGLVVFLSIYLQPNSFIGCSQKPLDNANCRSADAIVVVSGGNTNARAEAGIELYKNDWAPLLVFSGAAEDKSGPSNAAAMYELAVEEGVPKDAIVLDEDAETTKQNAEKTVALLKSRGAVDVILVTSGYHQKRASLEFEKRADGIVFRNHPLMQDGDWGWWWFLTPRGWWLAGSELVKIIAFYAGASS